MKSISKLKDEARRYEQREEWEKAIAAYLQVLRTADEGETEVELPLYNRLGDLCVRLGKPQEAVRHYEQAADRYAEAGLFNNAIALCNKALRYSPDRLELIRKLGQFSASQGFITDARRYFLDYAERQFNAGKVSDALGALEDFANVSDDADVREMLGRQLQAHGRINDAVDELKRAHALRVRDNQTQEADAVRREILAIDPNATFEAGAAAPVSDPRAPGPDLPGLVEIEPERPATPAPEAGPEVEGLETGARPGPDSDAVESIQLAGFETADESDLADIDIGTAGIEGLETTSFDFDEVASETPTLDDLGLEREATSFDGKAAPGEADVLDLPTLDDPPGGFDLSTLDDPAGGFDLPTLDDPDAAADLPLLDEPDTTEPPAPAQRETAPRPPTMHQSQPPADAPPREETEAATDLPGLDEPHTADRPGLDDPDIIELPDTDDDAFDLPLLGDDEPADLANEAAPMPAPEFDDAPAVDPAPPSEEPDFGRGGDLPLDLSSLSGFDFSTPGDEEVDTPPWETAESTFDIPELDSESLGLPSWEPPEDAPSFDLPPFDTDVDEAAGEEGAAAPGEEAAGEVGQPPVSDGRETTPSASSPADQEAVPDAPVPDMGIYDEELPVVDIPAIELPTWDTGLGLDGMEEPGGEAAEEESSEPSWLEPTADEDEEISPDLPTFTYEDDTAEADEIPDAPDVTAADPPQTDTVDDDPLGLAAHLAARAPAGDAPDTMGTARPLESDWLDEVAEDDGGDALDDIAGDATDVDDAPLDVSTDDSASSADEVSLPVTSVEDTGAVAARAAEAADDLAAILRAQPAVTPEPEAQPDVGPAKGSRGSAGGSPPAGDDYVDLGALVTGDSEEETTRFRVRETAPTGDEDRDFAELLSQFKAKVHQHLPPEDAAAHYDLGLAFKEMGLIDEAIGEFQVALRAGHMRLQVYEELGQCFLQKEQFNIAEKVLSRALTMKFDDELELLGVYYHLGRAYEALGRREQARDAYERVLGMDINFGDVTDRLARL